MSAKTQIRITLEQIEEEIKQVCSKDLNKLSSIKHLNQIIQTILKEESLESYFSDNASDINYFLNQFSSESLMNLIKKSFIPGNGDDDTLDLFISYISLLIKFKDQSKYLSLWGTIRELFVFNKPFYQPSISHNSNKKELNFLNMMKMMSYEEYNKKLIVIPDELRKENRFLIGDIVDVKITQTKEEFCNSNSLIDRTLWVRGLLIEQDQKTYKVSLPGESCLVEIEKDSINIATKGTLTLDYDWRISLYEGDVISCFDNNIYYTCTIVKRNCIDYNGIPKVTYLVGYRIYLDALPNWEDFSCYWDREITKDQTGRKYIGFSEQDDELISCNSKRIQKIHYEKQKYNREEYYTDQFIPYINKNDQSINYVVGRETIFSYFFAKLITKFLQINGLNNLLDFIKENITSSDVLIIILQIINNISPFLHIEAIKQYSSTVKSILSNYLINVQGNDIRNLKKESVDLIISILNLYFTNGEQDQIRCDKYIRQLLLDLANKMIKTSILDKRIMALKIITDILKEIKNNQEEIVRVIEAIYSNNIINEIYGKNSHMQLIKSSSKLINYFVTYNKLSDEDFKTIWSATRRNDYESKLVIIELLKSNSPSFQHAQINTLLGFIYLSDTKSILNEEIDLVYFLSNEDNFMLSLDFLFKVFYNTSLEEKDKFTNLIIKISDFVKFDEKCKTKLYEECLNRISSFSYSIHCLKILQVIIIKSKTIEPHYNPTSSLQTNFKKLIEKVKGLDDLSTCIIDEEGSFQVSIASRLSFALFMLSNDLWLEEKLNNEEDTCSHSQSLVTFIYDMLVEHNLSPFHFFQWLTNILNKGVITKHDYPFLFDFFKKLKYENYTKEAFDSFLKIFLDLNEISYSQRENKIEENKPHHSIESLKGFSTLWDITFTSNDEHIINKGINLLYLLYKNNPINLLSKCLELLKHPNETERSIKKLKLLINESEKNGTGGIKPHYAILKEKIISITVSVYVSHYHQFHLLLYYNTTIWEIRKIIAKKVKISSDFLKIIISSYNHEINNTENCKTLSDLKIKDHEDFKLYFNKNLQLIPKAELIINNQINPQLNIIFNQWFDVFSTEGKMLNTDCANFVKTVTNIKEEVRIEDSRVISFFNQFDPKKEGFISREGFLKFFTDAVMTSQKQLTVWENLNVMGIRNDLKAIEEDYFYYDLNKESMLRYQLSQNQSLIDTLLEINLPTSLDFLNYLCTNDSIYNEVYLLNDSKIFSNKNITQMIYIFQIIQSLVEELEFKNKNKIVSKINSSEDNDNDLLNNKIEWVKRFIINEGLDTLMNLFYTIPNQPYADESKGECLSHLITIFKIIFNSYFNQLDISKKINIKMKNAINSATDLEKNDNNKLIVTSFDINSDSLSLNQELSSQSLKLQKNYSSFNDCLDLPIFSTEVKEKIEKYFNCNNLIQILLQKISINKFNSDAFELVCILIALGKEDTKFLTSTFIPLSFQGLKNKETQEQISTSLIKLSYINAYNNKFDLISSLMNTLYDVIATIEESNDKKSINNTIFDLFSNLLEIYLFNKDKLSSLIKKDLIVFIYSIATKISLDLYQEDEAKKINKNIFKGYITILAKVIKENQEINQYISTNFELITDIYSKILFNRIKLELKDIKDDFVNPDKYNSYRNWDNEEENTRKACYNLILSLVSNNERNLEKLLSINLFAETNCSKEDLCANFNGRECFETKKEGHVGIANLRCICYMNSIIQQFFMMPTLRYALLKSDDNVKENLNQYQIDDNVFHQIQRMFSYLDYSNRHVYNPFGFCFSFKDYDGYPTNVSIQQDSNEFLCRFISIIEDSVRSTQYKYIPDCVFKGKQCIQIECNDCHHIRYNYEEFSTLSLEVKNYKNLYESLDKYFSKDTIDDFNCEECKKKVQIIKKHSLGECPNTVIIYLQRLLYDYEIEKNKKINSFFEFPKKLNLQKYSIEFLSSIENDEIYRKSDHYYEYNLVGINVHLGTADEGHFFSYINSTRCGKENEMDFNDDSWLKFNDSQISKFNNEKIESECFGNSGSQENSLWNSSQSAYMLFYERMTKSPIKMMIDENQIQNQNSQIITLTSENKYLIQKQYDYHYNQLIKKDTFSDFQKQLYDKIFYDQYKNEHYYYIPYYSLEQCIPKNYFYEIFKDNFFFQNTLNAKDEPFLEFYNSVFNQIFGNISYFNSLNQNVMEMILKTFLNIASLILSYQENIPYLQKAKELFISFLQENPSLFVLNVIIKYYCDLKLLPDTIMNNKLIISQIHLDIIFEAIIKTPHDLFFKKDSNELDMNSFPIAIIRNLLCLFPHISNQYIQRIGPLGCFIRNICIHNQEIMKYFIQEEGIGALITFLIGKESPFYEQSLNKTNKRDWDSNRLYIIHYEPFVDLLLYIHNNQCWMSLLSPKDHEILLCEGMLKFLSKNSQKLFTDYVMTFSFDNYDYTLIVCKNIIKSIDDCFIINDLSDLNKIMKSVFKLLEIKDKYQIMRMHILLGYPQLVIEDYNFPIDDYNFPLIGYNLMTEITTKVYEIRSLYNEKGTSSLIKKIISLEERDLIAEAFILILTACQENNVFYNYINSLLAEELMYKDFIDYGYSMITLLNEKKEKYLSLYDKIMKKLNNGKKEEIVFIGDYLIGDIQKEQISLLNYQDKYAILRYDYITKIKKYDNQMTFDDSRLNMKLKNKEKQSNTPNQEIQFNDQEDNDNNNEFPNNPDEDELKNEEKEVKAIYFSNERIPVEKEWLLKIMNSLKSGTDVIVNAKSNDKDNNNDQELNYNTIIRLVAINFDSKDAHISFSIDLTHRNYPINEFIPEHLIKTILPASSTKTILTISKINPIERWSFEKDDLSCPVNLINIKYESIDENEGVCYDNYDEDIKYFEHYDYLNDEKEDY